MITVFLDHVQLTTRSILETEPAAIRRWNSVEAAPQLGLWQTTEVNHWDLRVEVSTPSHLRIRSQKVSETYSAQNSRWLTE
jgi:hypothetical protein